ncbi:MAG: SAM-dependent methyltransferase [Lachnospiraceae bacterium]
MEELTAQLDQYLNQDLIQIIISNSRQKDGVKKIHVRPILLKDKLMFQLVKHTEKQVFHENLTKEEMVGRIPELMDEFKQLELDSPGIHLTALVSKKGKITVKIREQAVCVPERELSHNRKKQYILDPNIPIPFLQDLSVQTAEGKIANAHYDKFKQINRFLEFIEDVADQLPNNREAVIIDFGCGKSYLTFAMYYYLKELKKKQIRIIGLDLKEDVIKNCNQLRDRYGYEKLEFQVGDIAQFQGVNQADMVVSLHACDTATDYALYKAISWGAKIILSVPCCQHELNQTMENDTFAPIFKYGLIKERMAALYTDAFRGNLLEEAGYQVQLLEFINMEHTPKNILIRAVKTGKIVNKDDFRRAYQALNADMTLYRLLEEGKEEEYE